MAAADDSRRVPPEEWLAALGAARAEGYVVLDLLAAVDERDGVAAGVDVVAHLVDPTPAAVRRVAVVARVPDGAVLASASDLWPGAAWHERAAAELSGVAFEGESRRLLLPPTYDGPPPLAKATPLAARGSTPWPGATEPGEREGSGRAAQSGGEQSADRTGDAKGEPVGGGVGPRRVRRRQQPPGVPDGWPA